MNVDDDETGSWKENKPLPTSKESRKGAMPGLLVMKS